MVLTVMENFLRKNNNLYMILTCRFPQYHYKENGSEFFISEMILDHRIPPNAIACDQVIMLVLNYEME